MQPAACAGILMAVGLRVVGTSLLAQVAPTVKRILESQNVPEVTTVNQVGSIVGLGTLLKVNSLVFVDCISWSCSTICPVMSAHSANLLPILIRDPKDGRWVRLSSTVNSFEFLDSCNKIGVR